MFKAMRWTPQSGLIIYLMHVVSPSLSARYIYIAIIERPHIPRRAVYCRLKLHASVYVRDEEAAEPGAAGAVHSTKFACAFRTIRSHMTKHI
jgi:hypothetical protein